ncbi:MAG TPA: undecaprenyl-diphosphate phosphatase [Acidimicrobiales bacterium]|nr:undecaprenyl-diphosphate phosphatase [Acidimicrobiales bacterium]
MSYLQAAVIALVQGVTELFPVSSLGHSVLVPAWIGGSWHTLVTQSSQADSGSSFYLAFIVALHCATALALLWFFRVDWVRIIRGFFRSLPKSLRERRLVMEDSDERLAWMIVIATIPVGLTGVALEHAFRTLLAKPEVAAIFLLVNGAFLLAGERFRRLAEARANASTPRPEVTEADERVAHPLGPGRAPRTREEIRAARESDARISRLSLPDAIYVGLLQITALCAGISRSGVTMVGGLWRGLDHEDAARFAFLLATPPILAAGILKLPSLTGDAAAHIHGQVIVGAVITAVAAYFSVRFLVHYFQTRTLTPFAVYCLLFGAASIIRFAL